MPADVERYAELKALKHEGGTPLHCHACVEIAAQALKDLNDPRLKAPYPLQLADVLNAGDATARVVSGLLVLAHALDADDDCWSSAG